MVNMVAEEVRDICRDIRALKIQGAREIAKAAVQALGIQARKSKAKKPSEFLAELLEAADALAATRPTEPMLRNSLRNAIRHVLVQLRRNRAMSVGQLKAIVAREETNYFKNVEAALRNIAEYGAKEIPQGATVITHCHSSTVMAVLKRAHELGKSIDVIACETRPKYQGHITARELRDAGVPVTLIVDSAMKSFIRDAHIALVGADAISATGDLYNKIGTSVLALVAHHAGVPFYSAAELHKFDPLTMWGTMETIEERAAEEIAGGPEFKGVRVRNPAFDVTPAEHIHAYITEMGVIPPQGLLSFVRHAFPVDNPLASFLEKRKR
ncbi:MAG: S-methyl-5-thioribose-1-phosphate isomerase [Candidatus Micrarchaeia archaeon]